MDRVTLDFRAGFWRLADPKISLASFASMFLGAAAAAAAGPLEWPWLGVTVLGIFALEVAKNASGEIVDFDSGTDLAILPEDRSPFSGGKRVLVDGLLTRRQTLGIAAAMYALGIGLGLAVAWHTPAVLWLGLAGLVCAWGYHAPPLQLSYRGLGELAVALCYGPLIAGGTYLVQRGSVNATVLIPATLLGLLVGAFLWINEFPDQAADRAAGKRTLVVQLGRERAAVGFALIVGAVFAGVVLLPLAGFPRTIWLGLAGAVPAGLAARTLLRHHGTTARIVPAQGQTLLGFLLLSLGCGSGLLLG